MYYFEFPYFVCETRRFVVKTIIPKTYIELNHEGVGVKKKVKSKMRVMNALLSRWVIKYASDLKLSLTFDILIIIGK